MKKLFNELVETDNLTESALYYFYLKMLNDDKKNDKFIVAYKIDEEFALQINPNI